MTKWIHDEPIPIDWKLIKRLHSPRIGNFDMPENPTPYQEDTIRTLIPECTAWQKKEPKLIEGSNAPQPKAAPKHPGSKRRV